MKTIETAPLFKRIVAAAMDALLVIFLFFIIVSYVTTPIATKTSKYEEYALEIYQQEVSSHLYMMMQQNSDGEYEVLEVKDYSEKLNGSSFKTIYPIYNIGSVTTNDYIRYLHYYYTVYMAGDLSKVELPNVDAEAKKNEYISPIADAEKYTARYFNTKIMGLSPQGEANQSEYYDYPLNGDISINYEGVPVVKSGADESKVKEDIRDRVYTATKELIKSEYIDSRQSKIKSIQLWSEIPVYVFLIGIFYVLIPILFKNGETLGKKTLGLGIAATNGYHAKKRQILFRSLIFVIEISFSLFIVGYGLTSFATLGVGCVIMMLVAVFTKNHQAPHDLAAMTMEISMKKTVFFENAEEENRYHKQVQENIDNLHKYEPENPNIIQVGSKIIDPKFKPKKEKKTKNKQDEK